MKAPKAYIGHRIEHRLRLVIPSKRGDSGYFIGLENSLQHFDGVREVRGNPLTGSVLIRHDHEDLGALSRYSTQHHLFRLQKTAMAKSKPAWSEVLSGQIDTLNAELQKLSDGRWDLPTVAASGLVGLSILQVFNGNYLPPAWTLFTEACELVAAGARRSPSRRGH